VAQCGQPEMVRSKALITMDTLLTNHNFIRNRRHLTAKLTRNRSGIADKQQNNKTKQK
jgi:hypothetical protein